MYLKFYKNCILVNICFCFKIHSLVAEEVFGNIRCLMPFRLTGGNKDFILVGSDAGKIVILEYVPGKNAFVSVSLLLIATVNELLLLLF